MERENKNLFWRECKRQMNLYYVSQSKNSDCNTYDSMVVCAPDEDTARRIHPSFNLYRCIRGRIDDLFLKPPRDTFGWAEAKTWVENINEVGVVMIGKALPYMKEACVILSSFNAG